MEQLKTYTVGYPGFARTIYARDRGEAKRQFRDRYDRHAELKRVVVSEIDNRCLRNIRAGRPVS